MMNIIFYWPDDGREDLLLRLRSVSLPERLSVYSCHCYGRTSWSSRGNVIALPLFMETFAFFFEAIFLGIYLYTWDRFENQKKHLLLLIPVAIGASFSAVFITMVNAFMNAPQGFDIVNGELVNINPLLRC